MGSNVDVTEEHVSTISKKRDPFYKLEMNVKVTIMVADSIDCLPAFSQ